MRSLLLTFLLIPCLAKTQDITGDWNGSLNVAGIELRLVFHISKSEATYQTKLDSPDQNAFGIPAGSTSFNDSSLEIKMAAIGARYEGRYAADTIAGKFFQAGQVFPLTLSRKAIAKKELIRPQEPKSPFPYRSEEVKIPANDGKIQLAGTLTLPEGASRFPTVILISGSGPQNRDEEFMTHKPFLVLADYLTRKGIAVLRYDDRGFAQSTGDHHSATSADFANDVRSAIAFLKTRSDIDKKQIGLIGHSEGGLIAPMIAADTDVGFIVLLAGPGLPGRDILLKQIASLGKLQGLNEDSIRKELNVSRGIFDLIVRSENDPLLNGRLHNFLDSVITNEKVPQGMSKDELIKIQVAQYNTPWLKFFLKYDPAVSLKRVKCPVLAINGAKDVQVDPANLRVIANAVRSGGNRKVRVKEFANMNHLFQTCKTGAVQEYATIEETMSPVVLSEISNWILAQTK